MNRDIDLLNGNLLKIMVKLSLPLMGTAFLQMAYSLVDLIWLGKLSTEAVAAVGSCGFFIWIAQALTLIPNTSMSVGMSQALGRGDRVAQEKVARSGMQVAFFLFVVVTFSYFKFGRQIIGFYGLEPNVYELAIKYFRIVTFGVGFIFLHPCISSFFYSRGNSVVPFKVSIISLIFNIIFDPILIFGIGPFPKMGIEGAALATVMAQAVGIIIYIIVGINTRELYVQLNYFKEVNFRYIEYIFRIGVPTSIQSIVHAIVGIVLNKYIAKFGPVPIAAYSIGANIESISWMSADGFSIAFSSIFGQNYGAKNFDRIKEARKTGMHILSVVGIFASLLLFCFSEELFSIFISNDMAVIKEGSNYLRINAISETFMAYEIGTAGMMNGLSLTRYPALNSVFLNILRIPLAYFLVPFFGITGIWMAMSISSILKGVMLVACYKYVETKTNGFRNNMGRYVSKLKEIGG